MSFLFLHKNNRAGYAILAPKFGQNFAPSALVPHLAQTPLGAAAAGSGILVPQFGQNLAWTSVPQFGHLGVAAG